LFRSSTLPVAVREAVYGGPNSLSVISYWEVLMKNMKGKLDNRPGDSALRLGALAGRVVSAAAPALRQAWRLSS
jgi:PIN domain nuclease of toxin-antitoxin system